MDDLFNLEEFLRDGAREWLYEEMIWEEDTLRFQLSLKWNLPYQKDLFIVELKKI